MEIKTELKKKRFIEDILNEVMKNKKYKSLSEDFVREEIKKYLRFNPSLINMDKQIIKDIRKDLHIFYSSFQTKKKNKRDSYLRELDEKIKKDYDLTNITKKLLSMTISTKERLEDYEFLYKKIFSITKIPNTIVDLGSGLNPLSYPLMDIKNLNYYSYDIDEEDKEFLNKYFNIIKSRGLMGNADILDLRDTKKVFNIPQSDIIFLFKLIDVIDREDHKNSEELIKNILNKTCFIVASFSTRTLTRKKMNFPRRRWFELMLTRNDLLYQTIETNNEIFYIIKNNL